MTGGRRRGAGALLLGVACLLVPGAARAWDPATTHAGLTEKAVLASSLHKVLSRRLGRPLGLLEPLQIHSRFMEPGARRALWARLQALDPAGGYRPGSDGVATALSWVVAGSVLSKTPPERGRHHFLDPRRRSGLDDAPGLTGAVHTLRLVVDDGATARQVATGTAFDLTGQSSLDWLASPANELGLPAFLEHLERSVAAAEPPEREWALVRALLALGGIAAVLEDAGEPAHVRNDFRRAHLASQGRSVWDRASDFERFVAARYGRIGVPAPREPIRRPTLESYFTAEDGEGLADRTQRRFFSPGTIPADVPIAPETTTRDVLRAARQSLEYPLPRVSGLELRTAGQRKYLRVEGRRALGYVREPGSVRFFLDEAVHADAARALLPEIAAYTAGLLDHLLRAELRLEADGRRLTLSLEGVAAPPADARLRLFAEDRAGRRQELAAPGQAPRPGEPVVVEAPPGARRIAAVLVGKDAAGPFIAAGEAAVE